MDSKFKFMCTETVKNMTELPNVTIGPIIYGNICTIYHAGIFDPVTVFQLAF